MTDAVALPVRSPSPMSAPVYPKQALQAARSWQGVRKSVGIVCMPVDEGSCTSCGGEGIVYLRFLRDGPTKTPRSNDGPATWVASSPAVREGWFMIDRTDGYHCPRCGGSGMEPGLPNSVAGEETT